MRHRPDRAAARQGWHAGVQPEETGVEFTCEILPPLREAIEAMGKPKAINGVVPLTYLVTELGKPFSANGFSKKLGDWTDEAGLPRKDPETGKPRCTAHGLRKSAATRTADMSVPLLDMMRWFGWKTPNEALHYIETAERRKAAKSDGGQGGENREDEEQKGVRKCQT
jgi:hypothetical protein